jgi:hypothetical protein
MKAFEVWLPVKLFESIPQALWSGAFLSLEHPNRIDLYFVVGLLAVVAVSVCWLMRRK